MCLASRRIAKSGANHQRLYSRFAIYHSGLFDIVRKDCGHALASAGTTWRVSRRGKAMSIAFPQVETGAFWRNEPNEGKCNDFSATFVRLIFWPTRPAKRSDYRTRTMRIA